MDSNTLLSEDKLKELGFHKQVDLMTEFIYQVEGCKSKLVLTRDPLNSWAMFILMPDFSKIQFHPETIEDIKSIQRMFANSYYENHCEAWFADTESSN